MKLTVGVKILLGFTLALVIQVAVAVVSYRTTNQMLATAERVTHTYQVLGEREQLLSLLKDAETGQRGFLLIEEKARKRRATWGRTLKARRPSPPGSRTAYRLTEQQLTE